MATEFKKLTIIIPVFNEEATVKTVLDRILEVELINGIEKELIVVNDASKDDSENIILGYIKKNKQDDIRYFKHENNKGKGAALHTGIKAATGDYLVVQDADLEYDPQEFNLLLKPVFIADADVVYGSRLIGGKPHRILFYWHSKGNRFLTNLSNMFTNLNLSDMETCYKLVKTSMAQSLKLKEKRFGFEPEITAKLARVSGVRFYEVGISYYGRTYEEGKKIGWKDGVRAIYCIIKYKLFK